MSADDLTALYSLPPEDFVAARDELAKKRRAEGDREGAKEVRQLRRPTVPAWAVDQLALRHADDLERLFEAGAALRLAQQQALAGRAAGLREAGARRRELIDGLTDRAAQILTEGGRDPAPHRLAIAATLEAATVDDEAATALRAGTLAKELAAPAGFGDLTLVAELPEEEAAEPADEVEPAETAEAAVDRDAELRRAREEADEAERAARDAERAAGDARREAEIAAQEVERLEDELAEARRRAKDAAKRARDALDAAERARGTANEARDALRDAPAG